MNASIAAAVALGDQIERFGSYFGYAAVIGLGVLSLLYFAQAREVKRLREWAGRSPERDAELAQRVLADSQRRAVVRPAAQPPPAPQAASPQTAAAQADAARKAAAAAVMEKFQPPGSGPAAPVIGPPGQLTRPAAGPGTVPVPPAAAGTSAASGSAPPAGTSAPPPGSAATTAGSAQGPSGAPRTASSPSAPTAASVGAAAAAARTAAPSRDASFGNGAGGQDTHESDAARPEPLPDLPPRPARGATPVPGVDEDEGGIGGRVGLIAGGGAAVLVALVALVLVLGGGGDAPQPDNEIGGAAPPPAAAPAPPPAGSASLDRKATPVAVLNGTTQTGLASAVARTIEDDGFTIIKTDNNADQQIATTTVSYAGGSEEAARAVAKIVKVADGDVKPVDTNTAAAVPAEAKIVVIVGNDRSSTG